jgi:uncharacterized lipoprotein YddW (UPF0748 family)
VKNLFRHAVLTIFVLFFSTFVFAKDSELRGIWISDPTHFHWETVVADVKKAGLNTIFVNFASAGVAFFPNSELPYIKPDQSMHELLRIAHKEGLQVHAKILTFFMHWAPEAQIKKMKQENRLLKNMRGKIAYQSETPWLDPAQEKNRALMQKVIAEILTHYPVDGLQLDYIRYFEENSVPPSVMHVRQKVIQNFVSETAQLVKKIRPQTPYSACVFYNLKRAQNEMAQNWEAWIQQDIFSFLCPMNYTIHPQELGKWLSEQHMIQQRHRTPLYSGLGAYMDSMTPKILLQEIDMVRHHHFPGFVLFSYNPKFVKKMMKPLSKKLLAPPLKK